MSTATATTTAGYVFFPAPDPEHPALNLYAAVPPNAGPQGVDATPVRFLEVHGLQTDTRVFAAYHSMQICLGFVTIDPDTRLIEMINVYEPARRKGMATLLLDFARMLTGWPLDSDNGQRTAAGHAWATANDIRIADGYTRVKLADGDIARQTAQMMWALG